MDVREYDAEEVKGAWVPIKYQPTSDAATTQASSSSSAAAHSSSAVGGSGLVGGAQDLNTLLGESRAATLGLASDGVLTQCSKSAAKAKGDQFLYNTVTGETKWEVAHHQKLARGRDHHDKVRCVSVN